MASELGFGMETAQDVYSSDSTPFADKGHSRGVACADRSSNTATIHNSYDTMALMSGEQMVSDIDFLIAFTDRMANAKRCPWQERCRRTWSRSWTSTSAGSGRRRNDETVNFPE